MKNIGLIGFGCVNQGVYTILKHNPDYKVGTIVVRSSDKQRAVDNALLTTDINKLLNDPTVDVVMEAISDDDAALKYARVCLAAGKHYITANKKLVAENLPELMALSSRHGVSFHYEAAVAAGIPILQTIQQYYHYDQIQHIEGILNGSSNYILTSIIKKGKSFDTALEEAREAGFAEEDPRRDLDGTDAANKLSILAFLAFGIYVHPDRILRYGLYDIPEPLYAWLKKHEMMLRLKGYADASGNVCVLPSVCDPTDALFFVDDELNAVSIQSSFAGRQTFTGKGAGSLPTGIAMVSDLNRTVYSKVKNTKINTGTKELETSFLLINTTDFYDQKMRKLKWSDLDSIDREYVPIHISENVTHRLSANPALLSDHAFA